MIDWMFPGAGPLTFGWRDALDIILMAVLIYQVGLLIRGTRALQTLLGVLVVIVAYWSTGPDKPLRLATFHQVLGHILFYAPFAVIVLFQSAIRRVLARLGRTSVLGIGSLGITGPMIEEIVAAVLTLSARRTGALIVIEREQALKDAVESGIALDAHITRDLLLNIYTPGAPLHDGAVVVGEGRVRAASCFLPVTTDPRLSREYGSRHRAAIGLTEEYDSVAIVVSEERGEVRTAVEGTLSGPHDMTALRAALRRYLEVDHRRGRGLNGGPQAPGPQAAGRTAA
ncbi:MAG TPA: diadenylate cyclase CdaA [Dongiaceae bacterium]|nr:diadenylate cyclase CdaA [Dongiaceae bacterium]